MNRLKKIVMLTFITKYEFILSLKKTIDVVISLKKKTTIKSIEVIWNAFL